MRPVRVAVKVDRLIEGHSVLRFVLLRLGILELNFRVHLVDELKPAQKSATF